MFALCGRVMLVDKRLSGRHNLYSERCKLQAPAPPSPPLPPSPRARALLLGCFSLQLAFALFSWRSPSSLATGGTSPKAKSFRLTRKEGCRPRTHRLVVSASWSGIGVRRRETTRQRLFVETSWFRRSLQS